MTRAHAAAALAALALAGAARAETPLAPGETGLRLSATGEATATPDEATITLGVEKTARTAREALAAAAAAMAEVLRALAGAGIAPRDIQTTGIGLQPQFAYQPGEAPRPTGYQASNEVAVRVRDVRAVGAVVDAVTAAGATRVGEVGFDIADPAPVEDAARRDAVRRLRAHAEVYAEAAGMRLGRLAELDEGVPREIPPRPVAMARMAVAKAAPTPVEAGESTVRVEVSGVFALVK